MQMFCRGSKNDTRGFRYTNLCTLPNLFASGLNNGPEKGYLQTLCYCSCGLWVLLHSLSVRVEDGESQMAFTTTCDFIHQFFMCEECREHFYNMCSR